MENKQEFNFNATGFVYKNYSILKADGTNSIKLWIIHSPSFYKAYGYSGFCAKYTTDYNITVKVPKTLIPSTSSTTTISQTSGSTTTTKFKQYHNIFDMNICPVFIIAFLKTCIASNLIDDSTKLMFTTKIELKDLIEIVIIVVLKYLSTKGEILRNNHIYRLYELLDDKDLKDNIYIKHVNDKLPKNNEAKTNFINDLTDNMFKMTYDYYSKIYNNYTTTTTTLLFSTIKDLFGEITDSEYNNYFSSMSLATTYDDETPFKNVFTSIERASYQFMQLNLDMTQYMPTNLNFRTLPYISYKTG